MKSIAAISPRAAVTESHARLEGFLREALIANGAGEEIRERYRSATFLLQHARKLGLLSSEFANIASQLTGVRNQVAHEPDQQISGETALRYVELVADVIAAIGS